MGMRESSSKSLWEREALPRAKCRSVIGEKVGDIARELSKSMAREAAPGLRGCAQSCLTLWDPMDCSPPGSSARTIFFSPLLSEWIL